LTLPATLSNGNLYIQGTNRPDAVSVTYESGRIKVTENQVTQYFTIPSVSGNQVFFWGYDGDDRFANSTGLRVTAYGMKGNDVLVGGYNSDHLYGGDGDDQLWGGDGNDWLAGENGNDALYGQGGNDVLLGAFNTSATEVGGADRLYGGVGDDQ